MIDPDRLPEITTRWQVVRDDKDGTPVALGLQIDTQAKFDVGWLVGEVQDRRTDLAVALSQLQDAIGEVARLRALLEH